MVRKSKKQVFSLKQMKTNTVGLILLGLPFYLLFDLPTLKGILLGWWAFAVLSTIGIWWSEK
jgi:hypothetical protein